MYNMAICDDDNVFLERLRRDITENDEYEKSMNIDLYESGKKLLDAGVEDYSLIIMDVQMEGLGGFETAKEVRKRNKDVLLAFCSQTAQPKPELFEVQPYRYLIKNDDSSKLSVLISELLLEMKRRSYKNMVDVARDGRAWRVCVDDILYISRLKRGSNIRIAEHCPGGIEYRDLPSNERLEAWYEELSTSGFEFAHTSYIVNMKHIVSIEKDNVGMSSGEVLRISRTCKQVFTERYSYYFSKKFKRSQVL